MTKQILIFLGLILICSAQGSSAFSRDPDMVSNSGLLYIDGLVFSIERAEIAESPPESIKEGLATEASSVLAVTLKFLNDTETKKISFNDELQIILSDNFGNTYSFREKPDFYERPIMALNDNYPSIYPGEYIYKTVFFEPPVNLADVIVLSIKTNTKDSSDEIKIEFPVSNIVNFKKPVKPRTPTDSDLKIVRPREKEKKVKPGDYVYLRIEFSADIIPPKNIFIISPNYTFEDSEHNYQYNIKIPKDQKCGPFQIVAMAEWGEGQGVSYISRSITLNVIDPQAECIEDCAKDKDEVALPLL